MRPLEPVRHRVPAPTGRIESLRVIKWADDHFEATWTINGRRFSMFFDPIMNTPKNGSIDWRYADGSSKHQGKWKISFPAASTMVPTIFAEIQRGDLIKAAAREHFKEIMSPDAMNHRKSAREANALQMYGALETILKVAGAGRPKGESFGLNERERLEIVQIASASKTAVDIWREGSK